MNPSTMKELEFSKPDGHFNGVVLKIDGRAYVDYNAISFDNPDFIVADVEALVDDWHSYVVWNIWATSGNRINTRLIGGVEKGDSSN